MEQPVSAGIGAKQMMHDFLEILKLAFTTKFGFIIVLICSFIYFFTLWMVTTTKPWTLYIWISCIIGIVVMSWLTWFRVTSVNTGQSNE